MKKIVFLKVIFLTISIFSMENEIGDLYKRRTEFLTLLQKTNQVDFKVTIPRLPELSCHDISKKFTTNSSFEIARRRFPVRSVHRLNKITRERLTDILRMENEKSFYVNSKKHSLIHQKLEMPEEQEYLMYNKSFNRNAYKKKCCSCCVVS